MAALYSTGPCSVVQAIRIASTPVNIYNQRKLGTIDVQQVR